MCLDYNEMNVMNMLILKMRYLIKRLANSPSSTDVMIMSGIGSAGKPKRNFPGTSANASN